MSAGKSPWLFSTDVPRAARVSAQHGREGYQTASWELPCLSRPSPGGHTPSFLLYHLGDPGRSGHFGRDLRRRGQYQGVPIAGCCFEGWCPSPPSCLTLQGARRHPDHQTFKGTERESRQRETKGFRDDNVQEAEGNLKKKKELNLQGEKLVHPNHETSLECNTNDSENHSQDLTRSPRPTFMESIRWNRPSPKQDCTVLAHLFLQRAVQKVASEPLLVL